MAINPAASFRPFGFQALAVSLVVMATASGCRQKQQTPHAGIHFTRVPQADAGGGDKQDIIEGTVLNASSDEKLVLYAKAGKWWIQPLPGRPFVTIRPSLKWTSATRLGSDYAALLVKPGYTPQGSLDRLPSADGLISAVAVVRGAASSPSKTISFSGYEWRVRNAPSDRGGRKNIYSKENAWVDANGKMHLRIAREKDTWTCAEVSVSRSLGYGTYAFTVGDVTAMDPASVLGFFTWDYAKPDQNYSEMDIDVSRRGDAKVTKNLQYSIQPHYVAPNMVRFSSPSTATVHSFRWQPGSVSFLTVPAKNTRKEVAKYTFTSGVPSPGIESVRIAFYVYGFPVTRFQRESEVVIERFEYTP